MGCKITPTVCGIGDTDQGAMTYMRHYGKAIHIPIYVFLLDDGERKLLIDSGLEDFMLPEGIEEELGLKAEYLDEALERLGVKPEEIQRVIHTHLHNDHCENDSLLENAKVSVQKAEWEFCQNPHPLDHRYDADDLDGCDIFELEGDAEIVSGVRVVFTPGGQSVIVGTEKSGKVLVTRFCCNEQNFPSADPAVAPGVHNDALAGWDSANKVKQMLECGEIDLVVPCHALWPGQKGVID